MTKTRKTKPAPSNDSKTGAGVVDLSATSAEGATSQSERPTEPIYSSSEASNKAKPLSKQQQLAALIVRDEGATLDQMIAVTGWLPHTTRAALTGLKKKGFVITSGKVDGTRTYRAVAPE